MNNKQYLIYGAGAIGTVIAKMMKRIGLEFKISDGNANLWYKEIEGKGVIPSVELLSELKCNCDIEMIVCINDTQEKAFIEYMSRYVKVISWRQKIDCLVKAYEEEKVGYSANYLKGLKKWWFGLSEEIDFWENAYAKKNARKHDWYINLVNNNEFYDPFLSVPIVQDMKILDVGSGIVSRYGGKYKREREVDVDVQAVDPLAFWYNDFNHKYNDKYYKVDVKYGLFEELSYSFKKNSVDLVIISNALDHCIDPFRCILQALNVLKIDGTLYIKSLIREACNEKFRGLHQWNIDLDECNNFIVWNAENYINITKELAEVCEFTVGEWDSDERGLKGDWGFATIEIKKKSNIDVCGNCKCYVAEICENEFKRMINKDYHDRSVWENAYFEIEKMTYEAN